jgi:RNA polymerase sigma factor (sigma-70 family)
MYRHGNWSEATANPLLPLLGAGFIQGLCRRAAQTVPTDLREECEAEAWLVLWQVHERLQALPEAERRAYATVCVRHRLGKICRREHRRRALMVSWDSLQAKDGRVMEIGLAAQPDRAEDDRGCLLDQIGRVELAAALMALPPGERQLLDLYYAQQLTDGEIARQRNVSPAAVKMRRHRAIVKLRQALQREEKG